MTQKQEGTPTDYSQYEVREYYDGHYNWIAGLAVFNAVFNLIIHEHRIRFILMGVWLIVAIVAIMRIFKRKAKVMSLVLYCDKIMIDGLSLHATELKAIYLYAASGNIDFVKKSFTKYKRIELNQEDRPHIHRQIKMFCQNNGIPMTNY